MLLGSADRPQPRTCQNGLSGLRFLPGGLGMAFSARVSQKCQPLSFMLHGQMLTKFLNHGRTLENRRRPSVAPSTSGTILVVLGPPPEMSRAYTGDSVLRAYSWWGSGTIRGTGIKPRSAGRQGKGLHPVPLLRLLHILFTPHLPIRAGIRTPGPP